ncbi:MAG: hypothetical protein ABI560_08810 [Myxococcales bacterium]
MFAAVAFVLIGDGSGRAAGDELTGDWAGGRSWLATRGLLVEALITGDGLANLHGGRAPGHAGWRANGDLELSFDTTPCLWRGGQVVVYFQAGNGPGITDRGTGAAQAFSNIEARELLHVSEAFFAQSVLTNRL